MASQLIWTCLLSSSLAVALVTAIKEVILWKLNRGAQVEDEEKINKDKIVYLEEKLQSISDTQEEMNRKLDATCHSNKVLLQDKIKFLTLKYLDAGEVSFEDRKLVHEMWGIYHGGLGGNGDLDSLMNLFNELPIKM